LRSINPNPKLFHPYPSYLTPPEWQSIALFPDKPMRNSIVERFRITIKVSLPEIINILSKEEAKAKKEYFQRLSEREVIEL
jgi:hypothetical protein